MFRFVPLFSLLALACTASADSHTTRAYFLENADILRAEAFHAPGRFLEPTGDYRLEELNDPALTKVTRDHGKTVIALGSLPLKSGRAQASRKVWSSYWFPLYERDLFESAEGPGKSVLEKFDIVRSELRRVKSGSVATEKERYSSTVERWEGLCDAWSIAAVTMPEPVAPVTAKLANNKSVTFSVGDQKALLLKTFERMSSSGFEVYGQRFSGKPAETRDGLSYGWVQPDIYPDQFHRFLEKVLFERKQAFVIDHDPSEAVWSEPVDSASFEILPVPGRNDQVLVRVLLFPAKQLRKENKDAPGKDEHIRDYAYILGGSVDWSNNLTVEYGIWLSKEYVATAPAYKDIASFKELVRADSRRSHPDFMYVVPESVRTARKAQNPELELTFIDSILKGMPK